MTKKREAKSSKRGQPRPRVVPIWRSRWLRGGLVLLLVALAGVGGWRLWKSDIVPDAIAKAKWESIALSQRIGFRVDEILVVGRRETTQKDLLAAVRLVRGAPILAFDLDAAKRRIEALPWIKKATIERMLPSTVLLNVEERRPLALWQNDGAFALIDTDGQVILRKDLERFADLLVVVGPDAPKHAAKLLDTLDREPELRPFVKAAVRVGGRRWNLRLKGDIDVRLPEDDTARAWARLAEYERAHRVLQRDVQVLDLRIPDRLIVRKAPKVPTAAGGARQET